ncbi:hypothetical protein [Microcoleus sp. herbarium2]|uniref:hypothetical protein n=1 Tax=Microcoleus sp. herbarium2 TaxID=3055433 RepID=UPI002FCF7034
MGVQKRFFFTIRRDAVTLDTLAWALSAAGEWQKVDREMVEIRISGIRDARMFYRAGAIARTLKEIDPSFDDRARQAWGLGSYEF